MTNSGINVSRIRIKIIIPINGMAAFANLPIGMFKKSGNLIQKRHQKAVSYFLCLY